MPRAARTGRANSSTFASSPFTDTVITRQRSKNSLLFSTATKQSTKQKTKISHHLPPFTTPTIWKEYKGAPAVLTPYNVSCYSDVTSLARTNFLFFVCLDKLSDDNTSRFFSPPRCEIYIVPHDLPGGNTSPITGTTRDAQLSGSQLQLIHLISVSYDVTDAPGTNPYGIHFLDSVLTAVVGMWDMFHDKKERRRRGICKVNGDKYPELTKHYFGHSSVIPMRLIAPPSEFDVPTYLPVKYPEFWDKAARIHQQLHHLGHVEEETANIDFR